MKFIKRSSAELEVAKLEGRADQKERIGGTKWKAGYREEINQFRRFRGEKGIIK